MINMTETVKKFAKPLAAMVGGIALIGAGVMSVLNSRDDADTVVSGEYADDTEVEVIDNPAETEVEDQPE